jgi:hypothetical protein
VDTGEGLSQGVRARVGDDRRLLFADDGPAADALKELMDEYKGSTAILTWDCAPWARPRRWCGGRPEAGRGGGPRPRGRQDVRPEVDL